jgi:hypothetical protein
MKRIYPLRDYSEHDVINLFSMKEVNTNITDSGGGDAGVIVTVDQGNLDQDPVTFVTNSYLGKTNYAYVGRNQYPTVPLKVKVAGTGDKAIGITMYETALYDENTEKFLYYPQKALENKVVLSGQAVPVLTRGFVTLDQSAFIAKGIPAVGSTLVVGPASGKFVVNGTSGAGTTVVGHVLATGTRVAGNTADYFVGAATTTGKYAFVKIDF